MSRSIFRHFHHLFRQARRPARSTPLWVEGLEERRNPVSATWNAVDGILRVGGSGTGINDRILIRQDDSASGPVLAVFDARSGSPVFVTIQNSPTDPTGRTIAAAAVIGIEVNGAGGDDLIDLNSVAAGFQSITRPATLIGGSGIDSLAGGDGNDSILGGDQADLIFGNEGDDTILGQGGNDAIFGSAGEDSLLGGAGDDNLVGGPNIDGDGDDTLLGEDGNDRLSGGGGSDSLIGGNGNDDLFGELGNDILYGDDTLGGG